MYLAGSVEPGRIRPPIATASPFSAKIGNSTRARNESCNRLRLLRNTSPLSRSSFSSIPEPLRQGVPVVGRPAELELTGDVAGQTTIAKVGAGGARIGAGEQPLVVPLDGDVHRLDQRLAAGALLRAPRGRLGELDAGPIGQILDRTDEVGVLDLLHEGEHVARLVAPEAAVPTRFLTHVERGCSLGVERAQPDPVAAGAFELNVLADDVDDRHGRANPLDVVVSNRHARNLTSVWASRSQRSDGGGGTS